MFIILYILNHYYYIRNEYIYILYVLLNIYKLNIVKSSFLANVQVPTFSLNKLLSATMTLIFYRILIIIFG